MWRLVISIEAGGQEGIVGYVRLAGYDTLNLHREEQTQQIEMEIGYRPTPAHEDCNVYACRIYAVFA